MHTGEGRERILSGVLSLTFAVALATGSIAVPFLALDAGVAISFIGVLTAISALAQLATRFAISWMLRRIPDRYLLAASTGGIAISCGLLAVSVNPPTFVVALTLQGVSRGLFWTSSQTHAIRTARTSVGGIAWVGTLAGLGAFTGAALAGWITHEGSAQTALGVAALFAVLGTVPALLLKRLPVFPRAVRTVDFVRVAPIWRRPGVRKPMLTNASVGAWRGVIEPYLPVILISAGYSTLDTGLLASVTSLAVLAGSALTGPVSRLLARHSASVGVICIGLGLSAVGLVPEVVAVATAGLVVSGFAGGFVQTYSPSAASESVDAADRGTAIAAVGTSRALALFATPLALAALITFVPLGVGMAVVGAALTFPATLRR